MIVDGHTESCCLARKAFDKRTPGLFKVEWRGNGFIGLCSKTYYCCGATDKYSTKGLSKRQNVINKDTFLAVLTNRRSGSGVNRGFRVRDSSVMTYIQENLPTSTGSAKYSPTVSARHRWNCKRICRPDESSFIDMAPRWKHPFTCIVAGPTGCGKTTFVARLLLNGSGMIDPAPERVTWYYGEWQSAYENLDIPNLHLQEGLPSSFDADKRNIVVLDDLMAETDGRVTDLFTKKSHHSNTSVIYLVQNIFSRNKESRTISLNTQYMVVFKNPRDASQITNLAKQMNPGRVKFVQEAFVDATSTPYGYLLVDLKQDIPGDLRLRTSILPDDVVQYVYMPKV